MPEGLLQQTLLSLAFQPVLLVWIAGMLVAIFKWRKMKAVSMLSFISFALLFLLRVVDVIILQLPAYLIGRYDWSSERVRVFYSVKAGLFGFLTAMIWILVLVAIFGWRRRPAEQG